MNTLGEKMPKIGQADPEIIGLRAIFKKEEITDSKIYSLVLPSRLKYHHVEEVTSNIKLCRAYIVHID